MNARMSASARAWPSRFDLMSSYGRMRCYLAWAMAQFPFLTLLCVLLLVTGCKKKDEGTPPPTGSEQSAKAQARPLKVGLVLDVGGRGDGSFNDSALRGIELWAAGQKMQGQSYVDATP